MNAKLKPVENLRYERKFAVEIESIKSFLYLVKVHPALFTETYAVRQVNSLYFDTEDYAYYTDTIYGKSDRQKVRIRWYGAHLDTIHDGNLEIKSKSGYLGAKDTFYLGNFTTEEFLANYRTHIRAAEVEPSCQQLFSLLRPTLIVSYLRRYFVSADKNFRITLDYALTFYDTRTHFSPAKKVTSDVSVLELKYAYEHDELARTITTAFPNRYSKSSKYRIGLESL
jgi:hypothetical protein